MGRYARTLAWVCLALVGFVSLSAVRNATAAEQTDPIDQAAVHADLLHLAPAADAGPYSRRTGSAGLAAAAAYVATALEQAGYSRTAGTLGEFRFPSMNIQQGPSSFTLTGADGRVLVDGVPISALQPSGVKPVDVPQARPLIAPLIYGGHGTPAELNG
ncbi:MAG: hypothetical protein ACREJ2_15590, partial [Planctomycetota bacterium]